MKAELKVTSAEEYAQKAEAARQTEDKGFLHQLKKTGAVVRVRRVDMQALILVGAVPMSLVQASQDALGGDGPTGKADEGEIPEPTREDVGEGAAIAVFMRQTVVENVLEPPLGYDETGRVAFLNGERRPVARVHPEDFTELFGVITGGEAKDGLKSFRNRKERRASTAERRRRKVRA
jgi:hypothetical protein